MISKRPLTALGFLFPAVAIYSMFMLYPLVRGIYLSLTDSQGGPTANFVGLQQFRRLPDHPEVVAALRNTVIYAIIVVSVQTAIGVAIAAGLFRHDRIRRVSRFLLLMPALISPLMAAFIWSYIYGPTGLINGVLDAVGLGSWGNVWLADPKTALLAIATVNVWMFAGYSAAIFLAGYANMPSDLLEAAEIDGAEGFRRFRYIEWPLLAPALTVNVTLSLIGSLKVFEFPLVLTNGGPANATQTLTMLIYNNVFGGQDFALGLAIAVVLLLLVVLFSSLASVALGLRERRLT